MTATALPSLRLDAWQPTKDTLHLFFQIVGKIRLVSEPPRNHWWHAPLYPTPRGAGTGPVAAGRVGKSSPVHLFWHSFDLALTRFSGRRAPEMPGADRVTREAYSHEVISFGFWTGDAAVPAPAFYSYTAPEPAGLALAPLDPPAATWAPRNGSHLALLMYDDVRTSASPKAAVLAFFESAYQAGAAVAGWDVPALRSSFAPAPPARS